MPKSSKYTEDQLQKAIDTLKLNPKLKITNVAREFEIPTLVGWIKGRKSRTTRIPINRILNDSQEEALKKRIIQLDSNFYPPIIEHIEAAVN
ncbi:predicted protein [Histoplasma mississippiense (nom. inval.)]|uniref:predicted protein n=1 Tax=Ajellomyces capsulatus (strain NAm1 / WU24) TaxID=2059318 RepID=UPI000157C42F|nr:predicted protein [Histoplasma mississippiense (nom. inval.)]EDN07965.1 predicted protein [Histoplasma mississippiense (nom. inval.)]